MLEIEPRQVVHIVSGGDTISTRLSMSFSEVAAEMYSDTSQLLTCGSVIANHPSISLCSSSEIEFIMWVLTIINHPPVITIKRWYKPFPNGLFMTLFCPHYSRSKKKDFVPTCSHQTTPKAATPGLGREQK